MTLTADDAGRTVLCGACGARVDVPPGPEPIGGQSVPTAGSGDEAEAPPWPAFGMAASTVGAGDADAGHGDVIEAWDAAAVRNSPPPSQPPSQPPSSPGRPVTVTGGGAGSATRPTGRRRAALVLAAAVGAGGLGLLGGWLAGRAGAGRPAAPDATAAIAADERAHADLVRLKSEAEALVVADRLPEAHAKYQELMARAAARPPTSPLLWDVVERAKVDQDRIYWILLARMDKGERAFGPGTPVLPNMPTPLTVPEGDPAPSTSPAGGPGAPATSASTPGPPGPTTTASGPADLAATGAAPSATAPAVASTGPASPLAPAAASTAPASRPALASAVVGGVVLRPVDQNVAVFNPAFLDIQIDRALRRGSTYLLSLFRDGELPAEKPSLEVHRRALHAVAVYALLSAGQATGDPRLRPTDPTIAKAIETLKGFALDGPPHGAPAQPVVYARAMRAAALSVYNRPGDRAALRGDVDWLVKAHLNGAYGPDDRVVRAPKGAPPAGYEPRSDANDPSPSPDGLRDGPAPGRPLLDDRGRPIELAHGGERVGPVPPPAPRIVILPPPRPAIVPRGELRVDPMIPGYGVDPGGGVTWDNFNSQIGPFGVARGAEAGVLVSGVYWKDVTAHWTRWDLPTGEWPYRAADKAGTFAMTAGGVASLLTAHDWMNQTSAAAAYGVTPFPPEVTAGLAWLDVGDRSVTIPSAGTTYIGYDLFALGRAGQLSGQKYFGKHDWYPEVAGRLVGWQHPNGSWGSTPTGRAENAVETAFHLIFLANGRHPVLMNKLRFDGAWQNRPRDLANAAASLGRTTERPVNWQVVTLDRPGLDWQDAPILYVASDRGPAWTSREQVKVREYVDTGGLLFLHADGGSAAFNRWAAEFAGKLYPQYPLADLPADHPLYTVAARVASPAKLKLRGVSNGSRLLVLVAADDAAGAWQRRAEREDADPYRFLLNLWTYVTGKTLPRPRLDTADIPPPPGKPAVALPVARVTYAGDWDPEPGAWPRLGRYTHWEADAVPAATPVAAVALAPAGGPGGGAGGGLVAPLAHLTGTAAYIPTAAEAAGLRAYVEAGGVLLVEACGGSPAFRAAADGGPGGGLGGGWLATTFPGLALQPATADAAPLLRAFDTQDDFAGGVEVRPYVQQPPAPAGPTERLRLAPFGKGYVLYCPLDLSTGLAGSKAWGVAGYSPDHAIGIMKNVLLWASTRAR